MWWHVCSYTAAHISAGDHAASSGATGHSWESGANDNKGLLRCHVFSCSSLHLSQCVCMCVWQACNWKDMWCSYAFLLPRSWITLPQLLQPSAWGPLREKTRDRRATEEKCRRLKYVESKSCVLCMYSMSYLLIWFPALLQGIPAIIQVLLGEKYIYERRRK